MTGIYNGARKHKHKNEKPRLCAKNSISNQNHASTANLKQVTPSNRA